MEKDIYAKDKWNENTDECIGNYLLENNIFPYLHISNKIFTLSCLQIRGYFFSPKTTQKLIFWQNTNIGGVASRVNTRSLQLSQEQVSKVFASVATEK